MSARRRFRDNIHQLITRRPSSPDHVRHRNSGSVTPALTAVDSASENVHSKSDPPPDGPQESGSDNLSSVKNSYKPLVPEALSSQSDRDLQTTGKRLKEMGATGWNALGTSLSVVNGAANIFPPLKAAVGGLLGVMKQIDNVRDVQSDFLDIARTIDGLQTLLTHYETRPSLPEGVKRQLEYLASAIDDLKLSIDDKIRRGLVRRTIEASGDVQDVLKAFRTIANLVSISTMDTTFRIQEVVIEVAQNNLLKALHHVPGAAFSSGDRRGCLQGTRVKLLEGLLAWAADDCSQPIYWLSGMAGTGKTAIAYTFSHLLASKKSLAATFFCSRSAECVDVRRIFPTIAWTMAQIYPSYRSALLGVLKGNDGVQAYSLEDQFQKLLLGPLQSTNSATMPTGIIVIDALDECESDEATERLLNIILKYACNLRVKVFISSRPEPQIRDLLDSDPQLCSLLRLHDVEHNVIRDDIKLYIVTSLTKIFRDRRNDFDVTDDWPPPSQIDVLINRAGKLFIYAFTVCKYIGERRASPKKRLLNVTASRSLSSLATAYIDDIYRLILGQLPDFLEYEELSITRLVLSTVICVRIPLSVDDLGSLVGISGSDVRVAIAALHSLLLIPPMNHDIPVSIFHPSFADYLTDPSRSKDWAVDVGNGHSRLLRECFRIMSTKFLFTGNTTHLETLYLGNSDYAPIDQVMRYACIGWCYHLSHASLRGSELSFVVDYLNNISGDTFDPWYDIVMEEKQSRQTRLYLESTISELSDTICETSTQLTGPGVTRSTSLAPESQYDTLVQVLKKIVTKMSVHLRHAPRNKSKMLKNNDIMKLWPTLSRMIRHIVKGDVGELSFESCYFHAYMMVLYRTGDKLYNGACQIIRNHLAGLVKQKIIPALPTGASRGPAKQLQGEVLLNILAQIWNNQVERMSQLNQVLKYMDRVYVRDAEVPNIWDASLRIICEQIILSPIKEHIFSAVVDQIQAQRDGYPINEVVVKVCVDMLQQLRVNAEGEDGPSVYERDLEPMILSAAEVFWKARRSMLPGSCDGPECVVQVESYCVQEESRAHRYLSSRTATQLREVVVDVFDTRDQSDGGEAI